MTITQKTLLSAIAAGAIAAGCTVNDTPDNVIVPSDKPDVTVVPPADKPDVVINPPASTTGN